MRKYLIVKVMEVEFHQDITFDELVELHRFNDREGSDDNFEISDSNGKDYEFHFNKITSTVVKME